MVGRYGSGPMAGLENGSASVGIVGVLRQLELDAFNVYRAKAPKKSRLCVGDAPKPTVREGGVECQCCGSGRHHQCAIIVVLYVGRHGFPMLAESAAVGKRVRVERRKTHGSTALGRLTRATRWTRI